MNWIHRNHWIQSSEANWLKQALIASLLSIITYFVGQNIGFSKGYQDGLKASIQRAQKATQSNTIHPPTRFIGIHNLRMASMATMAKIILILKKIGLFLKKRIALSIFIVIAITYGCRLYFKEPLRRSEVQTIETPLDSARMRITETVTIEQETEDAFMPYEKIKVHFEIALVDTPAVRKYYVGPIPFIIMFSARLANDKTNDINNEEERSLLSPNEPRYLREMNESSEKAIVKVSQMKDPDKYEATAYVKYSKAGSHPSILAFPNRPVTSLGTIEIEGSSVDVMNKHTNDYLLIIGVLTFCIALYSELRKKQSP